AFTGLEDGLDLLNASGGVFFLLLQLVGPAVLVIAVGQSVETGLELLEFLHEFGIWLGGLRIDTTEFAEGVIRDLELGFGPFPLFLIFRHGGAELLLGEAFEEIAIGKV